MDDLKKYLVSRANDDDIDEYLVERPKAPSLLEGAGRSLVSGAISALGGITSATGYVTKKAGSVNPLTPEEVSQKVFKRSAVSQGKYAKLGDDLSEWLLEKGAETNELGKSISKNVPQTLINKTAAGVGSMGPYMAAGLLSGGTAAPLVGQILRSELETQSNAAQTYQELKRAGADEKTAMRAATRQEWPDRAVNFALEPFGALSNKGRLVRAVAEAVQEGVLQEPGQNITQAAAMRSAEGGLWDYAKALGEEIKKYPEHFKEVGVPAMIAGGLVGGLSPGVGAQRPNAERSTPVQAPVHNIPTPTQETPTQPNVGRHHYIAANDESNQLNKLPQKEKAEALAYIAENVDTVRARSKGKIETISGTEYCGNLESSVSILIDGEDHNLCVVGIEGETIDEPAVTLVAWVPPEWYEPEPDGVSYYQEASELVDEFNKVGPGKKGGRRNKAREGTDELSVYFTNADTATTFDRWVQERKKTGASNAAERQGQNVEMMTEGRPQVGDVFIGEDGVRHTVIKTGKEGLALLSATGRKPGMTYEKFNSLAFRRLSQQEIESGVGIPNIEGVFGPIYKEYEGKPISAIAKLLKEKTGEVKNAIYNKEGEGIDFIYGATGKNGYGIGHIAEKHGKKILVRLPQIVKNGEKNITPEGDVRYNLGTEIVVTKAQWNGQNKRWVITAYDKNVPSSYGRSTHVDQFSPRNDSSSGLDETNKTLPNALSAVNTLSGSSESFFEPPMPEGTLNSKRKVNEVRQIIERVTGIPVREGQVRKKNTLGYIDHLHGVIRSKSPNDIATLLHEFGHAIDNKFKLSQNFPKAYEELAGFGRIMGYPANLWQSEGLAQFFQWRGIDPEQAYKQFPEYSKVFDEFLNSTPEAQAMVQPVFDAAFEYYHSTPEARLDAVINEGGAKKRRSLKEWGSDVWKDVRKQAFDRQVEFARINELVADAMGVDKRMLPDNVNIEAAARTMPGTQAVVNRKVNSFLSHFKGFSAEEYDQLKRYMVAGGALDYFDNKMDPGTGLSQAELEGIRSRTPDKIARTAEALRADYDQMMTDTLVRSGFVSEGMMKLWKKKYPNYVPMIADNSDGTVSLLSPHEAKEREYVSLAQPVKGRSGVKNSRDIKMRKDPVETMLENYKKFHDLAARNDVGKTLVNISKLPGMARVAEKVPNMGQNSFYIWDNGKKHFYATDSEIYAALRSLGEAGVSDKAMLRYAHKVSEVFKSGTTRYNPWFILKNLTRDSFTTSIQSRSDIKDVKNLPFINTFDGVMQMLGADKTLLNEAREDGVFYSSIVELNRENIPKLIKNNLQGNALQENIKKLKGVAEKTGDWNEMIELAPKLREYKVLREQGVPRKQAAMEAREANSDFQRAGSVGRVLNQYVPFLNAQIQGVDKAIRTFAERPVESAVKAGLYIMLPSIVEWLLYHDDEDYKGLDKGIKDTHWVFRLPGAAGDDFIRVPMPFEIGVLFGGATKRALDKIYNNDLAAGMGYLESVKEAALPELSVAVLRPWIEVWANKDSFMDRPIVPLREQQLPARLQYGSSTSYLAKLMGNLGVSPRKVDHLIRGYGGTMAAQTAHVFDVFDRGRSVAPERNWHEATVFRPYTISSNTSNHYIERFYHVAEELERDMNGAKVERTAYGDSGLAKMISGRRQLMSRIWTRIAAVKDSHGMSPAAKAAEIERLNKLAINTAKTALEFYDRRKK